MPLVLKALRFETESPQVFNAVPKHGPKIRCTSDNMLEI
jgi:hypothetical protein